MAKLIVLVALAGLLPLTSHAAIRATGRGSKGMTPRTVRLDATFRTRTKVAGTVLGTEAATSSSDNADKVLKYRTELQAVDGVRKVELGSVDTRPIFDRQPHAEPLLIGYETTQTVSVKVTNAKAKVEAQGKVYKLTAEHTPNIQGYSPVISEKARKNLQDGAKKNAAKDARHIAELELAAEGSSRIGKLLSLADGYSMGIPRNYTGANMMAEFAAAPVENVAPEFTIAKVKEWATITAEYDIIEK